jgi:hypothetical protein
MDNDHDWHGWTTKNRSLHVGYLPGRKQPALYMTIGGLLRPLAYFQTEDKAKEALSFMDDLVYSKHVRDVGDA